MKMGINEQKLRERKVTDVVKEWDRSKLNKGLKVSTTRLLRLSQNLLKGYSFGFAFDQMHLFLSTMANYTNVGDKSLELFRKYMEKCTQEARDKDSMNKPQEVQGNSNIQPELPFTDTFDAKQQELNSIINDPASDGIIQVTEKPTQEEVEEALFNQHPESETAKFHKMHGVLPPLSMCLKEKPGLQPLEVNSTINDMLSDGIIPADDDALLKISSEGRVQMKPEGYPIRVNAASDLYVRQTAEGIEIEIHTDKHPDVEVMVKIPYSNK